MHLYHECWEHESAYYALRHTILDGRVLRSHDPVGVEQGMWALLTLYQLLRRTMIEAAESRPGTDPDRCGFTVVLQTARDLLVCAEGVFKQGIGEIGRSSDGVPRDGVGDHRVGVRGRVPGACIR